MIANVAKSLKKIIGSLVILKNFLQNFLVITLHRKVEKLYILNLNVHIILLINTKIEH